MARLGKFFYINGTDNLSNAHFLRVRADGGITESLGCIDTAGTLLESASYFMRPSGFKEDTVYSLIPNNSNGSLNFTRASDAWRTEIGGLVQRTPYNLAVYSEQFENANWNKYQSTIGTDATLDPNGNLTADKIISSATTSEHYVLQNINANSGVVYSTSVYLKAGEYTWAKVASNISGSAAGAFFNLSTGVVGTIDSGVTASIQNIGNGWYRCTITSTASTSGSKYFVIWPTNSGSAIVYTGDGTSGIFAYGFQVVEGADQLPYFPTTDRLNVPRLSYMYGSCPALLLEPQRTNLCLYSSAVGGTGWTMTFAGVGVTPTVTTNYAVAPDGTTSASRLQLSLGGGTTTLDQSLVAQTLTGTSCRGSFYIKTNDGSTKTIYVRGSLAYSIVIDGTWKRYDFDAGTLSTTQFGIGLRGGQTPTNSNTADILVWGAQLEVGAYPTTYIPTTTSATATRVADSFSRNNIYTNGLISASGGTWFVELRNNVAYTRDASINSLFVADTNVGSTNGFVFRNQGSANSRLFLAKRVAGAETTIYQTTTDTAKIAIKWNGTTCDVFANGTKVTSASSFTTTLMEFLIGNGNDVPKFIQQMALFNYPLSDSDCQLLTT